MLVISALEPRGRLLLLARTHLQFEKNRYSNLGKKTQKHQEKKQLQNFACNSNESFLLTMDKGLLVFVIKFLKPSFCEHPAAPVISQAYGMQR